MDWEGFFRDYRKADFIPGYTILNKLGGGVFGEVYKARKTSIGKFYAIKFLKLQDERLSAQVMRELEGVDHFAQVDHPNLVSIEDRGEVGGIPYIVMGYAGDETLKTLLANGRLPRERTLTLFRQILQGVKALHEHSIVHFDLKPGNIFIKGEVARVGDYGLSKLMSESRATLSIGRGTPYYMAPEMLRRRGDARSDVYSLGVILFEMLTGDVPFKGDSEWEILKKHEAQEVRIPSSLPSSMGSFLRQSLDKRPERRFRSAGAMLMAWNSVTGSAFSGEQARRPVVFPTGVAARAGVAGEAARIGAMAGRLAARGRANLSQGRGLISEILQGLREGSRETLGAVREGGFGERVSRGERGRRMPPRERVRARRKRKPGGLGLLFVGLFRLLTLPLIVMGWLLSNLWQVLVILAILMVLGSIIHLGLGGAIM